MRLQEPPLASPPKLEKCEFENCSELFRSREVLEHHRINVHGVFENRKFPENFLEAELNENRGSEVFNDILSGRKNDELNKTEKSNFDWDIMAPLLKNQEQKINGDSKKCSTTNCSKDGKIFLCHECGFISGTKITGTYHMRKSHLDLSTTLDHFCHDCSVVATIKVNYLNFHLFFQTFL